MTRTDESAKRSMQIRYCPVCGSEVEPLFAFTNEKSAESTVECPEHGEVMIEYYERN